jgi:hypothetical protein
MVKQPRIRPPARANELYVRRGTPAQAYFKHVRRLFERGVRTVLIHGLTASIEKACRVANLLQQAYADLELTLATESIAKDGARPGTALHILVHKQWLI